MFGIKFTAILLITAIFNPLCCCLDLSAKEKTPAHQAEHNCCTKVPDSGEPDTGRHAQAECPHDSEKNSQISETPSTHDTLVKSQLSQTAILSVLEFVKRDTAREAISFTAIAETSSPPSKPAPEDYCVYIL